MHFVISLLAIAASASAASIAQRDSILFAIDELDVSSFRGQASYSANILTSSTNTSCFFATLSCKFSSHCSSQAAYAPAIEGIGSFQCNDPDFFFGFRRISDSTFSLRVDWVRPHGIQYTAFRTIPESDFACYTQGDLRIQDQETYIGSQSFYMAANTTTPACGA